MKKLTVLAVALALCIPSLLQADTFSLRLGYFWPMPPTNIVSHPNSLWAIELDQMSFQKSDFRAAIYGASYERFLTNQLSISISIDTYSKDNVGYYLDWVGLPFVEGDFAAPAADYLSDPEAFDVLHTFNVSMIPLTLSLTLTPLGRRTRIIPYVGGGGGVYFWRVRMRGEIIDFNDEYIYDDPVLGEVSIYPIQPINARESHASLGAQVFAGIRVPLGYRVTLEAQGLYHFVKGKLTGAFLDFDKFDLSGLAITGAFNYWF